MEKIVFTDEHGNPAEFYLTADAEMDGYTYLLVTDTEEGDSEALIMKDITDDAGENETEEAVYALVEDEEELARAMELFQEELGDIEFESE